MRFPLFLLLLALACAGCAPAGTTPGAGERTRTGYLGIREEGQAEPVTLAGVVPDSAAARAGLRKGDVIRAVDGKPLAAFEDLMSAVKASPDRPLELQVRRGGEGLTLTVTPKGRATDTPAVQEDFARLTKALNASYKEASSTQNWALITDPCQAFAKAHPRTDAGGAAAAWVIQFSSLAMTPAEALAQAETWARDLPGEPALEQREFASLHAAYTSAGGKDPQPWIDCLIRIAAAAEEPNLSAAARAQAAAALEELGKDQEALAQAEAAVRASPQSQGGQQAAAIAHDLHTLAVGRPAPDFRLPALDGGPEVSLLALKGKPVLLVFWASWCGPCKAETPFEIRAQERFSSKGLQLLSVCLDSPETLEKAQAYLAEHKITWPQACDGRAFEGAAPRAYNVQGIPALFLIDAEGRIAARQIRGEGIQKAVEALLGS